MQFAVWETYNNCKYGRPLSLRAQITCSNTFSFIPITKIIQPFSYKQTLSLGNDKGLACRNVSKEKEKKNKSACVAALLDGGKSTLQGNAKKKI